MRSDSTRSWSGRSSCLKTGEASTAGFSLVELMITLAVLAVLITLAVPSFTSLVNSNRLAAQANELVAGLQEARLESLRSNRRVTVCRSTNGTTCNTAAGATWGRWISFVDTKEGLNNSPVLGDNSAPRLGR